MFNIILLACAATVAGSVVAIRGRSRALGPTDGGQRRGSLRARGGGASAAAPRGRTAIEGSWAEVARPPLWRRVLALAGIAVLTIAVALAVTVVLAAIAAAISAVFSDAIG